MNGQGLGEALSKVFRANTPLKSPSPSWSGALDSCPTPAPS